MRVRNDSGMSRSHVARSSAPALGQLLDQRLSRRDLLKAALAGAASAGLAGCSVASPRPSPEIILLKTAGEVLPVGYQSQLIIAAGDPILPGAPAYQPFNTNPTIAAAQFGVNNDFIALLPSQPVASPRQPLSSLKSQVIATQKDLIPDPNRALLFANHEYPSPELLWPDLHEDTAGQQMSSEQIATTMAMVGASVCEIERRDGRWHAVQNGELNRRITATTPMRIAGPAAGVAAMRTTDDPEGLWVRGTLSNCNGGVTPWGTVLTCEEGAGWIFAGDFRKTPAPEALKRYYYDEADNDRYGWARVEPRFNLEREPNEPNRYEWVVEIDPYDPLAPPVKRTALGRFAHEGAQTVVAPDGRVVIYLGDDWEFEYCYRFVTEQPWDPVNRQANKDLLDHGVLSVACFLEEGVMEWRALIFGEGPLTPENGFSSQADVLINTRRAADLLGATPMDAPEGFKPHPTNGCIYIVLTSNADRVNPNPANPRTNNRFGHIIELQPPATAKGADHTAAKFTWNVLVMCGDPRVPEHRASFHPDTTANGWFTDPDNIAFDPAGRLWVCTDGVQPSGHDGLYVMPVDGPNRARPQLFYAPPSGAECCGPVFSDDGKTLFLAIQHPGEGVATLADVETHWPDPKGSAPPRAGVVAITQIAGKVVGGEFG
jgi:hypothetical protein